MPKPRKIFRIEETALRRPASGNHGTQGDAGTGNASTGNDSTAASLRHAETMEVLGALAAMLNASAAQPASSGNAVDRESRRQAALQAEYLARVADELNAVMTGTAQATQKILGAAEEIDQLANTLSAALKGKIERGLAQDISDLVIRIFEACNFQDLTGQRINKVLARFGAPEDDIAPVIESAKNAQATRQDGVQYLHGPRLDGDKGHMSQSEIDTLFGG